MSRSTWHRRARRSAILAVAAVFSVTALGAPALAADTPPGARDVRAFACPTDDVPPDGFTDTDGNTFDFQIQCLAWYGITAGGPGNLPASQYGPRLANTRAQMASFIARSIDDVDDTLLPAWDGENAFTDVSADNVHIEAINRLHDANIVLGGVGGGPADEYSPQLDVRRDQMASYIARAVGFIFSSDLCANVANYFDDDDDNVHEPCINALADTGVVQGRTPGVYAPAGPVTRDAMSAFIMRAMDILVEQELTAPPA